MPNRKKLTIGLSLLFLANAGIRLFGALHSPSEFFFDFDERELALICLDRFLGNPVTSPHLPASTVQMISLPVLAGDFVFHGGLSRNVPATLENFSGFLADAYADPRHLTLVLRGMVVFVASAAPILAFGILWRLSGSLALSAFAAAIVSVHPLFFRLSTKVSGDAVGFPAALAAVFVALGSGIRPRLLSKAAIWQAAAVASKFTLGSTTILPLLAAGAIRREGPWREFFRSCRSYLGAFCVGLLFFCPYLWTDSLRLAKSLFGNLRNGEADFSIFAQSAASSHGWAVCLLAMLLIATAVRQLLAGVKRAEIAFTLLAWAAMAAPIWLRSTVSFPRYYLPLLLPALVLMGLLQPSLAEAERGGRPWSVAVGVLALLVIGIAAAETFRREWQDRQPTDLSMAGSFVHRLGDRTLLVPEDFVYLYEIVLPPGAYQRLADKAAPAQKIGYLEAFLKPFGMSSRTTRILFTSFDEDEQALWARSLAAAQHRVKAARDVFVYADPGTVGNLVLERTTLATESSSDAIQQFQQLSHAAILLPRAEPALGVPFWRGKEWYWYVSKR